MKSKVLFFLFLGFFLLMACKQKKKYHDVAEKEMALIQTDATADILNFQRELNESFKNPETSPLPDRLRKNFESLDFFLPDTSYVIEARLLRTPDAIPFMMPTTTGEKSEEVVYGIAHFTLNGDARQLEIYQNKELMLDAEYVDYLFLPFTDMTNEEETYGGGRYIDLRIPEGDTIIIDFNRAYNPYCAYNKKYSCPIVPSVNHLETKVMAGVKDFRDEYK
ncbi:DUF1684 domain-containing protein [Maribacter algarum]|uniref:DUF1684 domain-containing protein n=1 Tax=Maribacter algarum (ex Zhang et al. 2020) TaxID=2578118 RepID=A0A5S3PG92_9FLAO|nr:DUF1684 domain-containing protein [Maribacter algarum]TMM53160.1 DUF1684 domain-containing protein [Maribacter algarum]